MRLNRMWWKTEVEEAVTTAPDNSPYTDRPANTAVLLMQVARPHQWTKNLFVLAPLLFSGRLGESAAIVHAVIAFFCFCLASSTIYVFNDTRDAAADRMHPVKRFRPLASGELSIGMASAWCAALAIASMVTGLAGGAGLAWLCALYLVLMFAYCLSLKRVVIVDAMLIAIGFVIRVIGGAVAISVTPSHWLIICAFLLALYLAFTKRRQELLALGGDASSHRSSLGAYTIPFLDQVSTILLSAIVVCYALYTVSPDTVARVGTTNMVYGTLFVLYGLLRYLHLVQTGSKGDDPGRLLIGDLSLGGAVAGWVVYNAAVVYWNVLLRVGGRSV